MISVYLQRQESLQIVCLTIYLAINKTKNQKKKTLIFWLIGNKN